MKSKIKTTKIKINTKTIKCTKFKLRLASHQQCVYVVIYSYNICIYITVVQEASSVQELDYYDEDWRSDMCDFLERISDRVCPYYEHEYNM